ncbi:phosphoethanolamine transferase [bacterium]|nr:phosphoethanolamine transferase [bacterium]
MFYFCHFGRYFIDADIPMLFVETEDIAIAFFADMIRFWYLPIICITIFTLSILLRKKTYKIVPHSNKFIVVLLCVFAFQTYKITKKSTDKYAPHPLRYMLRNSLKSVSSCLIKTVSQKKEKNFLPYKIVKEKEISEPTTVILYMLEGVSANNMSLYEYKRNTTPRLNTFKNDKNFVFKDSMSISVSTLTSLSMFFNFQKEAENYRVLYKKDANLFKMAKEQGFQTLMYSPQANKTFANVGMEYIDKFVYRNEATKQYKQKGDEYGLELLKTTKLKDKNFIVVQTRAAHYPYEHSYEHAPQFNIFNDKTKDFRVNTYDNAIRYIDDLLADALEYAKTLKGKVYFIITSDHGQLLGQDGLYGHTFLHKEVVKIPFILYTKNIDKKDITTINQKKIVTHYDISTFLAKVFGFDVINPNTPEDTYFINGSGVDGKRGFMKYKIENDKLIWLKD